MAAANAAQACGGRACRADTAARTIACKETRLDSTSRLSVEGFFDPATSTVSDILLDTQRRQCALVDPVLDYDPKAGRTGIGRHITAVQRVFGERFDIPHTPAGQRHQTCRSSASAAFAACRWRGTRVSGR